MKTLFKTIRLPVRPEEGVFHAASKDEPIKYRNDIGLYRTVLILSSDRTLFLLCLYQMIILIVDTPKKTKEIECSSFETLRSASSALRTNGFLDLLCKKDLSNAFSG